MTINAHHAGVVSISLMVGALARPYLEKSAGALPAWLATRAKARFDADVKSGKIPPPAARLAVALKRAVLTWADKELPAAAGEEKLAQAVLCLGRLPFIGTLVAADPQGIEDELQLEYKAMRAEISKDAGAQTT